MSMHAVHSVGSYDLCRRGCAKPLPRAIAGISYYYSLVLAVIGVLLAVIFAPLLSRTQHFRGRGQNAGCFFAVLSAGSAAAPEIGRRSCPISWRRLVNINEGKNRTGAQSEPVWFVLRREVLRWTHARSHPRLLAAVAVALILYCILSRWTETATAFLIAFDGGAVVFLAAVWTRMVSATPEVMRRRAETEDEGRYAVLGFAAAAAIAILLAIVFELHGVKDRPSALAVVLAAATI
jgi:hypothetical protein